MSCVICGDLLSEDAVNVRSKGLQTLCKYSFLRNDGLSDLFQSVNEISVHSNCRKKYTRINTNRPFQPIDYIDCDDGTAGYSSLASEDNFPFKEKCFICNEDVFGKRMEKEKKKPARNRDFVLTVTRETTKGSLLKYLGDDTSSRNNQLILRRIENVDLVDVQAHYHKKCYLSLTKRKTNHNKGRPECAYISGAMQIMYDYIDGNKDSQFTIAELKKLPLDHVPDDRTIKKKLFKKYNERLIITEVPGHSPILTLKDSLDSILIDSWYNQKVILANEDGLGVVKKAADIIREDIILKVYDKDNNPSPNSFLNNAERDVPESLSIFMNMLACPKSKSKSKHRKLLNIANRIISILKPRKGHSSPPRNTLDQEIPRIEKMPSADALDTSENVPLQHDNRQKIGLHSAKKRASAQLHFWCGKRASGADDFFSRDDEDLSKSEGMKEVQKNAAIQKTDNVDEAKSEDKKSATEMQTVNNSEEDSTSPVLAHIPLQEEIEIKVENTKSDGMITKELLSLNEPDIRAESIKSEEPDPLGVVKTEEREMETEPSVDESAQTQDFLSHQQERVDTHIRAHASAQSGLRGVRKRARVKKPKRQNLLVQSGILPLGVK